MSAHNIQQCTCKRTLQVLYADPVQASKAGWRVISIENMLSFSAQNGDAGTV